MQVAGAAPLPLFYTVCGPVSSDVCLSSCLYLLRLPPTPPLFLTAHLHHTPATPAPFAYSPMRRAVSKFIPGKLQRPPGLEQPPSYKIDSSSVDDFYIALDLPHKLWLPGEEILGQVILISKKHLANIAIEFCLSGYIKINALPHSKLKTVKRTLFNHNIRIYGPDPDRPRQLDLDEFVNGLYKGEHRFPFIVKLPKKRIFTSIDFGKGAIEYVLKTSLRSADDPVSSSGSPAESPGAGAGASSNDLFARARLFTKLNSAAYSSEKIISLVNPIDVAELPPPKPKRLIINDPRRNKHLLRVESSTSTINTFSTFSSNNLDTELNLNMTLTSSANPAHALTPGAQGNTPNSLHNTHVSPGNSAPSSFSPSLNADPSRPNNNIRVSMELPQSGYLRGELIPIKLNIHHLKKIQDTKGIIVTLVRVCRLDYGPDGLYESFRKDLLQLIIPLFVDPATFQLEINTSLRVPPDAFPTIAGCPMVSFQYFIEVMLNLSGKSLSVDGPSEHPKSNLAPSDDISAGPSISPGNQGNYTYHAYQNRSEFINTDKFKRLKKFLQITSEVVIGTHRLDRLPVAASPDGSHAHVNGVNRSSVTSSSNSASPSTQAHAHIQAPLLQAHAPGNFTHQRTGMPSMIGAIPESLPMNNFTPPYQRGPVGSSHQHLSPLASAPTYEDIIADVAMPQQPNLSEKERMRLHEQSLLPSEPQFDASSDAEDRETVSPMDPSHDILEEMVQGSNALSSNSGLHQYRPNSFAPLHSGNSPSDPLSQAVHDHLSLLPGSFEHEPPLWDENDLYESRGQIDNNDGIGPEGPLDFVPNYDAAGNDRLVVQQSEQEQGH